MAALFGHKPPAPIPVVNPTDTANRMDDALARQLQTGGTNADTIGNQVAPMPQARQSTLTGIQ
ncbi:MAG: hypothetical protein ACREEW_03240 [Caulobacteraceae bacterium]